MRVLVAEDDAAFRRTVRRLLKSNEDAIELVEATSLEGVREALLEGTFHCLLLDYWLPDGTAEEFLREAAKARYAHPPIVILTGLDDEHTALAALEMGAQDYLLKDKLEARLLLRAIRYAVERRRAEEAASVAEQRSQDLLEALPNFTAVVDREGRFEFVGGGGRWLDAASDGGLPREGSLLGRKATHLVARECRVELADALDQTFRDGGRREIEVRDRAGRHHLVHLVPRLRDGAVADVVLGALDVERLKQTEAELWRSQFVLERMADAVYWIAPDGRLTHVNDAACQALHYSREELLGQTVFDIDTSFPGLDWDHHWAELVQRGSLRYESAHRRRDGSVFPVEVSASLLPFQDQPRSVAFARDITERSGLEDQLRQAQKMEAVGRLAGGIAHDFNNLLTVILTFSRFVQDDLPEGDPRRNDLARVLQAADSATRLTGQLLSFARRRPVEPVVLELSRSILSISKMLRRTLGESIELVILPCDEPCHVLVDAGQLDQLVFNLAVNARDAMPDGGTLTFGIRREELGAATAELGPGTYVTLEVTDTGTGMSPEVAAQVFEPFFSTKGEQGTGLGLATCYGIAKQANGSIGFQSSPGSGTRFQVRFPLVGQSESPEATRPEQARRAAPSAAALLVEDQPAILEIMSRTLISEGFTVLEARTAEEALSLIEQDRPALSLLVSDVVLPGLSGVELAKRMRSLHPNLPILLISGFMGEMGEEEAPALLTEAATAFLPKPFTPPALMAKIRAVLEN